MRSLARSALFLAVAMAAAAAPQVASVPSQLRIHSLANGEAELLIYGPIGDNWWSESVTAQGVVTQLATISASVIKVRINSDGGSVSDGLAIYNALKRHGARIVVTIDGVAASIASLIAMAGHEIVMPPNTLMMLHAPWSYAQGNAQQFRDFADVLDTYASSMATSYASKTGKTVAEVLAILNDGKDHWYTSDDAIAFGLADRAADSEASDTGDAGTAAAALVSYVNAISKAPAPIAATLRRRIHASVTPTLFATLPGSLQPAVLANIEDSVMKQRLLEVMAHAAGAGPAPAVALSPPAPAVVPAPAAAPVVPPAPVTGQPVDVASILAADQNRRVAIRNQFAPFASRTDVSVAELQRTCEDDTHCTPEAAGLRLLAALGSGAAPLNTMRVEPGTRNDQANFQLGVAGAMLHRFNPAAFAIDDRSRPHAYSRLGDIARACLERAGVRTAGLSPHEIAVRALHSTADFPAITENIVTRSLRMGYEGTARTFVPFCRRAVLPDFKQISRTQLAGAPTLRLVLEGQEYEQGTIGDGAEKYSVLKYGRVVVISWETIINDDLDALTRIPQSFGASAGDLESDIVYAILTGNPVMADTVALFHADHANLGTAGALSEDKLSEMRERMLLQRGLEGRHITVRPQFLIVPPRLQTTAQKLVALPITPSATADANPFHQQLDIVVEPRLQDASAVSWFAAAAPTTVDTIEYGYLAGHDGVWTETRNGFEVDGISVKCRHVFGAKAIDHRGLFKGPGA